MFRGGSHTHTQVAADVRDPGMRSETVDVLAVEDAAVRRRQQSAGRRSGGGHGALRLPSPAARGVSGAESRRWPHGPDALVVLDQSRSSYFVGQSPAASLGRQSSAVAIGCRQSQPGSFKLSLSLFSNDN